MDQTPKPERQARFGIFEFDFHTPELRKNGVRIKLAGQPLEVLAMLLERPGELVTREELQKRLWPNHTIVDFEDGINAAINRLRESLDDPADNPRFVETLRPRGYRLIAPVVGAGAPVGVGADVGRALFGGRRTVALAVAALVLVIGGPIAYRYLRPWQNPPAPPMRIVPIASHPGQQPFRARFSPDGNRIAFVWDGDEEYNADSYVKIIGKGKPLRLTTDPATDDTPTWSPDGRYIAFQRYGHGEDKEGIYVIPAVGGAERKLYTSNAGALGLRSFDWSPDGKYLAYSDFPTRTAPVPETLFLLAVDNPEENGVRYRFF